MCEPDGRLYTERTFILCRELTNHFNTSSLSKVNLGFAIRTLHRR
jgi:hypothetical protein